MSDSQSHPSSYRLKFHPKEFFELLVVAKPKRIYRVKNVYYFSFDGFVMYCDKISENLLEAYSIIEAIEFSNMQWMKK